MWSIGGGEGQSCVRKSKTVTTRIDIRFWPIIMGGSMTDVQFPLNHTLVEAATRLKEEQRVLHERLEKIETTRKDVTPSVYEKVRADYAKRFEAARAALLAKKQEVDRELATLYETRQKITGNLDTHRETLEELQYRHTLGEFAEGEFNERAEQANAKIGKFEKLLNAVNTNIQRYEGIFAGVPEAALPPPTSPSAVSPTASPPPHEAPVTTLVEEEPTGEEEYLLEEGEADYFRPEPAEPTPVQTTSGATPRAPITEDRLGAAIPTLTIIRGEGVGTSHAVHKETSIGRASSANVVLKEAKVSRQHAILRRKGHRYHIEDLQSSNGLYVNGERVKERWLENGDEIQVGDFVLKFRT